MSNKPKLSKTAITGIGALLSGGLLAGSWFLAISPIMSQTDSTEQELQTTETLTLSKQMNLQNLQEGAVDIDNAEEIVSDFHDLISDSADIESASRAIAKSERSGINITSFSFGSPEAVSPREAPEASLDGFSSPFSTSGGSVTEDTSSPEAGLPGEAAVDESEFIEGSMDSGGGDGDGSAGNIQRVPVTIEVEAANQSTLTDYVNDLSQQDRLIFVTALESNMSETAGGTIYGYAFFRG